MSEQTEAELLARIAELEAEVGVYEQIIAGYESVMSAIPECSLHGNRCVPHAVEWVESVKGLQVVLREFLAIPKAES